MLKFSFVEVQRINGGRQVSGETWSATRATAAEHPSKDSLAIFGSTTLQIQYNQDDINESTSCALGLERYVEP